VSTSPAAPQTTPGRQLLLALMTVARRLKPRPADGRLDPASVFVLHHVLARGPLRVSELAKAMGLDASTVSRHVSHLEDGGYLARSSDPDDRRATRVRLTGKGQAVLHETMERSTAMVDRAIAGWPAADRETLTTLMTRLASSLDRLAAETETR
jgi:DNA-binding MarR family transcriptional regulator